MAACLRTYHPSSWLALGDYQGSDALAEFDTKLFCGDVGVLHGVVQGCSSQQFWVVGHRCYDGNGLQWMDYVGETLAAALGSGVCMDCKFNCSVQQGCV